MKNFVYSGQSLSFVATEPVKSGQIYIIGSAFGVVSNTILPGQSAELFLTGAWSLLKDGSDIKVGDKLYWDSSNKVLTGKSTPDPSTSNPPLPQPTAPNPTPTTQPPSPPPPGFKLVGMAAGDAPSGQSTVLCRLNGVTV